LAVDWQRRSEPKSSPATAGDVFDLSEIVAKRDRWFVLTGAGCSTASGIPAYRDREGIWRHSKPMSYQAFTSDASARARYWRRSVIGYPRVRQTRPNGAHGALAQLAELEKLSLLVTQNVDGLHQRAGSRDVLELHGSLSEVTCLSCKAIWSRDAFQQELLEANPEIQSAGSPIKPDGDVDLSDEGLSSFVVPPCTSCRGIVKPHVVFFGEGVPAERVTRAYRALEHSQAILVVGSSLAVFSGYRFAKAAALRGVPVVLINQGVSRADSLATLRIDAPCGPTLQGLVERL
jgi:NAD-dependent SIR2 family protein deacetylase